MHTPIKELITRLNAKLRGHYNYYGVIGNYDAMNKYREYVLFRLKETLNRRGAKLRNETFWRIIEMNPILKPKIVHRV
jgi:cytoplasmic iron level regulating protein YaaA (DUF328/UPF0246 family)